MMLPIWTSHVQSIEEPYSRWTCDEEGHDSNDALGVEWHGTGDQLLLLVRMLALKYAQVYESSSLLW